MQNELLTFDKTVTVEQVKGWTGLEQQEWYKGNGIYQIEIGSRCEVESVVFYGQVSGLWINDLEVYMKDVKEGVDNDDDLSDEEKQEEIERCEEDLMITVDKDGFVDVCLNEEYSFLYFKVA